MTATPQTILALVEHFGNNVDPYKSPSFNETQARREFIDLFLASAQRLADAKRLLQRQIDRLGYYFGRADGGIDCDCGGAGGGVAAVSGCSRMATVKQRLDHETTATMG